jgi:hypothetical protein
MHRQIFPSVNVQKDVQLHLTSGIAIPVIAACLKKLLRRIICAKSRKRTTQVKKNFKFKILKLTNQIAPMCSGPSLSIDTTFRKFLFARRSLLLISCKIGAFIGAALFFDR